MSSIIDLKHTDWDNIVSKSLKPVIVEFWHQNCPLCKKIEPIFLELPSKINSNVVFTRLNVMESRENRRLAIEMGVIGTPTVKIFCKGVEIGDIVGMETTSDLQGKIEFMLGKCN